jgi:hypothetical protein
LRKLLSECFLILPGGQRFIQAGPLDKHLRDSTIVSGMTATLENSFRYLEVVVVVGQSRNDGVLCRRCRLEQRHVEHRVDRRGRRKGQLVGDGADTFQHGVGAVVAEGELQVRPWCQRRLDVRLELEVDRVAHIEGALRAPLVGLSLHALLSAKEMTPHRLAHCSSFRQESFDVLD